MSSIWQRESCHFWADGVYISAANHTGIENDGDNKRGEKGIPMLLEVSID